jgi:lipopolysaccharide export system protein LptA
MIWLLLHESHRKPVIETNADSQLEVSHASMNYHLGKDKFRITGQKAFLNPENTKVLYFQQGVKIAFEKTTLKPDKLSIDSQNEIMEISDLKLEGKGDVFFHHAKISPDHRLTTASNLILIAPYPLVSLDTITKLESDSIKTKLQSLKLLQERNKKAKKSSSQSGLFQETPPLTKKQQPTESTNNFQLKTKHLESPLGRFNLRLKMEHVNFSVAQQSIESDHAKFQSSQTVLTFYGNVVLKAHGQTTKADYATLDLSSGKLDLDQNSMLFPVKAL